MVDHGPPICPVILVMVGKTIIRSKGKDTELGPNLEPLSLDRWL